jgi:NADPH:quinone reductase-like Zn-dependent oxidoreductase
VSIAFHYVKTDRQGAVAPAGVRTQRVNSAAEQADWLRHMKRIYLPQANIDFRIASAQNIDSNGVQAPDVDVGAGSNDGDVIIQGRGGVDRTAKMSDEADPKQLSMIGINPVIAYLLLNRYVSLMPGDWIGQTAANSAMGQYIIALAKLAGVKTLNVVRREEAAEQVRQWGGDRVVLQAPVGELAKSLKTGGSIVVYGLQSGQSPAFSLGDFVFRGLSLHGFWLINWIRNAPRAEIQEIYQKLGDLVADGSLSAAVDHVYPLEQFKEAFEQSLKPNRRGKILFKFGTTDGSAS